MSNTATKTETHDIVVDEVLPHAPEVIWKALTTASLIGRWLMVPTGFEPVEGTRFTFQTTPAGPWDGVIHCEVLEVVTNQRLSFAWQGGSEKNVGYGARLDTTVTWTLSPAVGGTRLQLVHSGFVLPGNEGAFKNMGEGWKKVVRTVDTIAAEQEPPKPSQR